MNNIPVNEKVVESAIEATRDLGIFAAKFIKEPIEQVTGILTDKLKYIRWERQIRLLERANKFISERGIKDNHRIVSPKFAFPIIEHASLEEDDFLQDIWAKLLVTSIDPSKESPHIAYIDIIRQLDPLDVKIIHFVYLQYKRAYESRTTFEQDDYLGNNCEFLPAHHNRIINEFGISDKIYKISIDNLMRLRLAIPYHSGKGKGGSEEYKTIYHGYYAVCITPLGVTFVAACVDTN